MTGRIPDREVFKSARRGDEAAFRELYERYAGTLRAQIARQMPARLRRRVTVSDVLQETFATAFGKIGEFEGPHEDSFRRWLARIAELKVQRYVRDHLETGRRAAGRELSRAHRPATGAVAGSEPSPSAHAIAGETGEALRRALAELSDDYRQILRLVHDEGLSVAAAGARMDRSAEAARKLYGRAVSRLAERLYGNG